MLLLLIRYTKQMAIIKRTGKGTECKIKHIVFLKVTTIMMMMITAFFRIYKSYKKYTWKYIIQFYDETCKQNGEDVVKYFFIQKTFPCCSCLKLFNIKIMYFYRTSKVREWIKYKKDIFRKKNTQKDIPRILKKNEGTIDNYIKEFIQSLQFYGKELLLILLIVDKSVELLTQIILQF